MSEEKSTFADKIKNMSRFWKIYIISTVVFILLMGILLIVGYNLMMDYDESQNYPASTAENYATTISSGSYVALLNDKTNAAAVFEYAEYEKLVNEALNGKKITSGRGYSEDRYAKPIFNVKADGKNVAEVSFKLKSEKSKFGFDKYDIDAIKSLINGQYEVSVVVPEYIQLYINAIPVERSWITDSNMGNIFDTAYNLSNDLNPEHSKTEENYVRYDIKGLLAEPEIRANIDASHIISLVYNKELKAWCCEPKKADIIAPDNASVSVNGIEISSSDKWTVKTGMEFEALSGIAQYMDKKVVLKKYTVTGVDASDIKIISKNFDGAEVPVYYDSDEQIWFVRGTVSETYAEENGLPVSKLKYYAQEYAKFVANDGDRWSTIMPDVMPGSELYETFDSFWAVLANHNSYWFEDLKVEDISFYAEDAFSCRITYEYWIKGFAGDASATESYPTDITFYYVKENGRWYITDWELKDTAKE